MSVFVQAFYVMLDLLDYRPSGGAASHTALFCTTLQSKLIILQNRS